MKTHTWIKISGCIALVACGGGGDSVAGIDGRGQPMRVAVFAEGPIDGFGSVIVNGVRYDTSNASFDIDGTNGTERDLAVGQVVKIRGTTDAQGNNARADRVIYADLVQGPVESVDVAAARFVVLGQTVLTNADTAFEDDLNPQSIEGISPGIVVEVSGFANGRGEILATYIEREDSDGDFEVTGIVSNLDSGNLSFEINGLRISYSRARLEDFPNGGPLANGQRVEAEGTLGTLGGRRALIATSVEFEGNDDLGTAAGNDVEISGLITRFVSATDFDVNGKRVTSNASTRFSNGSAGNLALNVAVEVEGKRNASGVIVADSIEFEREGTLELRGTVEATTTNSVTLLGVTATVTSGTALDDQRGSSGSAFVLRNLNVGDYVEVRGFYDGEKLTLTGLKRKDAEDDSGLEGPVSAVNAPNFTALGVTVATTADTEFEGADDNSIDAETFFDTALNKTVEVDGNYAGGVLTATEVEIQDDNDSRTLKGPVSAVETTALSLTVKTADDTGFEGVDDNNIIDTRTFFDTALNKTVEVD